jgi:hypothetical protein
LASLVFFALPSACAILGAVFGRPAAHVELAGALAGLAGGLVAAGVIVKFFDDRKEAA